MDGGRRAHRGRVKTPTETEASLLLLDASFPTLRCPKRAQFASQLSPLRTAVERKKELEWARNMRAQRLVESGWVETPRSVAFGRAARAIASIISAEAP